MVARHPAVLGFSVSAKLRPALAAIAALARLDAPALARGQRQLPCKELA